MLRISRTSWCRFTCGESLVAIQAGKLRERFDILILPSETTRLIVGKEDDEAETPESKEFDVPPEYRSGIKKVGIKAVEAFVDAGGTLIAFNHACDFAIEKFNLRIKNVVKDKPAKTFFCPGSTLRAHVDTNHPLGYGMPNDALILCWPSPTFEVLPSRFNENYEVVVTYPERDILQSGWLVGESEIVGKAALVSVKYGKGRVILYGFRPQHRAQMHGTFKLLFNALINSD